MRNSTARREVLSSARVVAELKRRHSSCCCSGVRVRAVRRKGVRHLKDWLAAAAGRRYKCQMNSRRLLPLLSLGFLLGAPLSPAVDLSAGSDWAGPWTTRGYFDSPIGEFNDGSWVNQTTESLDGQDAVGGTLSTESQITTMETTMTGPATLYFSCRVKNFSGSYPSHQNPGFFLHVNDVKTTITLPTLRSEVDSQWYESAVSLPAGQNSVKWELGYFRGATPVNVYLDQIWTSDDPRPRLTETAPKNVTWGTAFSWTVPVHSVSTAAVTASGLPPGIEINETSREVFGIPTVAGLYESTLTAVNAAGRHVAKVIFNVHPGEISLAEGLDSALSFSQSEGEGSALWKGSAGVGSDGIDSASVALPLVLSGSTASGHSTFQATVPGPGALTFWVKNERSIYDRFDETQISFYLGTISPETTIHSFTEMAWTQKTIAVPAGPQKISWSANRIYRGGDSSGSPPPFSIPLLRSYVDQVSFTPSIVPPQSTFAAWQVAWNVAGQPASGDTDGDGLSLLLEYATGGDPYTYDLGKLPVVSLVDDHLTLSLPKSASPTDLLYFVQSSRSLVANSWSSVNVELLEEDENHLLARCKKSVLEEPIAHLRVLVVLTP